MNEDDADETRTAKRSHDDDRAEASSKRKRLARTDNLEGLTTIDETKPAASEEVPKPRWNTHDMAEQLVELSSHIMLYPTADGPALGPFGFDVTQRQAPLEAVSALAYLQSPLRRPSVMETWSPYEIAVFEASMAQYGKDFYQIHKVLGGTKSTKQVIDFYYIWKKTSHYQRWKQQYVPPHLDVSSDDQEESKTQASKETTTTPVQR